MNTKSPDVLTSDSFMWYWGLNKHDLNIWHTYGDRIKMSYKCLLLCTSMGTGKFCIDEGIGMECSHFILKRRKMRSNQGQHCKIFCHLHVIINKCFLFEDITPPNWSLIKRKLVCSFANVNYSCAWSISYIHRYKLIGAHMNAMAICMRKASIKVH